MVTGEWECGVFIFIWLSSEKMPRVSGTYGVKGNEIKMVIASLKIKVNTPLHRYTSWRFATCCTKRGHGSTFVKISEMFL